MNKENAFLIYCSRINLDSDIKNKLHDLSSSGLDWDALVKKAMRQGVAQFLYWHLSKIEEIWSAIPFELRDSLKNFYYGVLSRNWRMQLLLKGIISELDNAEIPAIVLKGPSLLETVYKNIGLRPMSDVDLLVKNEDLPKIKLVLHKLGYQKPKKLDQDSLEKFGGEIHLSKSDGLFLDIHSNLSQYERMKGVFKIDKDIWSHSIAHRNQQLEFQMLDPAHLIIHLCIHHSMAHSFVGLFRFCDLREAIFAFKKEIDWDDFIAKAKLYKVKTLLFYSLMITQELYKEEILQNELLLALKPGKIKLSLINFLIGKDEIMSLPDNERTVKKYLGQLFLMDSYFCILEIIFKSLFPSNDWLIYKYRINSRLKFHYFRIFHPLIFISRLVET